MADLTSLLSSFLQDLYRGYVASNSGLNIQLQNGTAALPSLTFASETNKGIYSNVANQVGISLAGALVHQFKTSTYQIASDSGLLQLGVNGDAGVARVGAAILKATDGSAAYGTFDVLVLRYSGTALQVYQSGALNPVGTANTSGLMMGLAGAITPASTRIHVIISGNLANSTISDGGKVEIRYGTGGAPSNAGALTGTIAGNQAILTGDLAANNKNPFTCSAIITGLAAGVAVWLDVDLAAITGGTATITEVMINAHDLP